MHKDIILKIDHFDALDFEKNVSFIFRGRFRDVWVFLVYGNSIDNGFHDSWDCIFFWQ